jgi:hypothetical protein
MTQRNVKYQIQLHNRRKEEETVVKLVTEKKQQYPMPRQIIIYCNTVKKTKRLAAVLRCVCYHRETGSRAEKGEMVQQLTEGRQ